jgi:hypothetical protein
MGQIAREDAGEERAGKTAWVMRAWDYALAKSSIEDGAKGLTIHKAWTEMLNNESLNSIRMCTRASLLPSRFAS